MVDEFGLVGWRNHLSVCHGAGTVRRPCMESSGTAHPSWCVASGTWRRNWPNRNVPAFKTFTTMGFHLRWITSMVALTGHSEKAHIELRLQNCAYRTRQPAA
jgi:hypothetical protein